MPRAESGAASDGPYAIVRKEQTMRIPTLVLVPAALIALASVPAAQAANMTQSCAALEGQFDQAAAHPASTGLIAQAKVPRAEGAKLCSSKMAGGGVAYLRSALKYIGEKPQM